MSMANFRVTPVRNAVDLVLLHTLPLTYGYEDDVGLGQGSIHGRKLIGAS